MSFPIINEDERRQKLTRPTGRVRMVLDTDTFNQIDDQYAVVYALLSQEKLEVEALYAIPFVRSPRSRDPADGMEKSYLEILRLLERLDVSPDHFVFKGSPGFLDNPDHPPESDAVNDLIEKTLPPNDRPLYVVAIGALTNVAAAVLQAPEIIKNIVVVWLGGHAYHGQNNDEFNLSQDITAAQVVFDCGVPLVHIPCRGGAHTLEIRLPEIAARVKGRGAIGDYLYDIFKDFAVGSAAPVKIIWDIAPIAWLIHAEWVPTELMPSPVLNDDKTWRIDPARHLIRSAREVNRDAIFEDFYRKLDNVTRASCP